MAWVTIPEAARSAALAATESLKRDGHHDGGVVALAASILVAGVYRAACKGPRSKRAAARGHIQRLVMASLDAVDSESGAGAVKRKAAKRKRATTPSTRNPR